MTFIEDFSVKFKPTFNLKLLFTERRRRENENISWKNEM